MRSIISIVLIMISASAYAYVGPGLGVGVLGTILGGIAAVFLALAGVIWYPLKRLFKKKKPATSRADADKPDDGQRNKKEKDEIENSNKA